jgi:hypothetical protein
MWHGERAPRIPLQGGQAMSREPYEIRRVSVIEVIEVVALKGCGTRESIAREVTQYWTANGVLLAESDPTVATVQ